MSMKTIELLKAWDAKDDEGNPVTHQPGTQLEVDEKIADALIAKEAAKEVDPVEDGLKSAEAKVADETRTAEIVKHTLDALSKDKDGNAKNLAVVTVKNNSDDDPLGGYGPQGHSYTMKDCMENPQVVHRAFGEFCKEVMSAEQGKASERLSTQQARSKDMRQKAAGTGMIVGDDEHGGYLIFSAASQMINMGVFEAAVVRPLASRITMGTQLLKIPYLKDENHTSSVYGGIWVYFDDELDQLSETRPEMAMLEFKLKKMTALGYASGEWVKWSPVSLGSWLIPKFMEAVAWREDQVFINGGGGALPKGMLNSDGLISITKETGQDADTVVRENIDKIYARQRRKNSPSLRWLINHTVFPQMPKLNVDVGTGGAAIYVNNISGPPGQRLWGSEIIWSEFAATLGDAKDVSLVDIADYVVADDQSGPEIAQSMHLKFDYDQVAFRIIKYIDGQNFQQVPFTPHTAGATTPDTLSTVVHLGART